MTGKTGWLARAVAATAVVCALTACGGPDDKPDVATAGKNKTAAASPQATLTFEESMRKYAGCMRDNGVNMPDPAPGATSKAEAGETDPGVMQSAMAACRKNLPGGGDLNRETNDEFENRRQVAKCMRESGFPEWPDPERDNAILALPKNIDLTSAPVKDARKACQKKHPLVVVQPSSK